MNQKNNILNIKDYEILISESVGKGHPDKICDQISDHILDACLKIDPESRVACEVMAANTLIIVSGEITTKANINVENEVWKVIKPLGYNENSFTIICNINKQSDDIAKKVNKKNLVYGAGDQGITYGYATNETKNYLPISYDIANELLRKLEESRINKNIAHIRADMKSQVEIHKYGDDKLVVNKIILAIQHDPFINKKDNEIWKDQIKQLVHKTLKTYNLTIEDKKININAAGDFIIGGPIGDTGLTGRKLQVDTYGTIAKNGGGAFSGKDYTKVDRTGSYLCRWIAKNIVFNKLADKCEIGLAWEIGNEYPDDLIINCFNTNKLPISKLKEIILNNFYNLNLTKIIHVLDLKKPIYASTSVYGHFGNEKFSWEKTFDLKI